MGKKYHDSHKGYIYLIKHKNEYKIGYTKDIHNRMGEYTKLPYPVIVITVIEADNARKLKAILHNKFSEKRLRGEWFDLNKKDVEIICKCWDNLDDQFNIDAHNSIYRNYVRTQADDDFERGLELFSELPDAEKQKVVDKVKQEWFATL